ncbi:MAG: pilus assembly protein [Alphaproteobacteria bacterium]|nr:pilus assembly protein [Alphaproteobacteria bacterium]
MRIRNDIAQTRLSNCTKGVATVEFALIIPLFLLMLMGLFDFGNFLYQRMELENAVNAGSKYAIRYTTDTVGIESVITSSTELTDFSSIASTKLCECSTNLGVSVSCSSTCVGGFLNEFMTVTAVHNFTPLFNTFPSTILPATMTASRTVRTK